MTNLNKYLIEAGVVLVILFFIFVGGCSYGKHRVICPEVKTVTVIQHDTIVHNIPNDIYHYVTRTDTVIKEVPMPILSKEDSLKVWNDYFAKHYYTNVFTDSLLQVTQQNEVSENVIHPIDFKYRYLGKTTVINNSVDNSIHYAKYITIGGTIPFKNVNSYNVDLRYTFNKGYIGGVYYPSLKSFGASAGFVLFKFK